MTHQPPALRLVLHVPAHPASVGAARRAVRSLVEVVDETVVRRGELVVSELVTNAVRHASTGEDDEIVVEITADRAGISGSVSDRGPAFAPPQDAPDPTTPGGFGLYIVGELSASWSVSRGLRGNEVRFNLVPEPVHALG